MMTFQKGNRVRVTRKGDRDFGKVGTVGTTTRTSGMNMGVNLDEPSGYHFCGGEEWCRETSHMWIGYGKDLTLLEFKAGDKVELIKECEWSRGNGLKLGHICTVDHLTDDKSGECDGETLMVEGKVYSMNRKHFKLIGEGKMELKDRIEAITGWDKDTDDILKEIGEDYELIIPCVRSLGGPNIDVMKACCTQDLSPRLILKSFSYFDQCSKLQAFKNALMYLAEKTGKLEPELVGTEHKAEIEGKTYKVRVLERL